MKKQSKTIICTASLVLLIATAFAQSAADRSTTSGSSGTYQSSSTQPSSQSQPQFFQAKNFIGEKVKNGQDQSLGTLKDIVFNPQNGQFFAAVDIGSSRYALVPWQALNITTTGKNKQEITLNSTKESLQSGPTVMRDQWDELNNPTFVQSIYTHYNVQPPTGVGGSLGTGTSGSTSGSSSSTGALPREQK
jgi:PRC-barrel domain protein